MKKIVIAFLMATASLAVMAQSTPVGLWKTIDDETKTEKSLVRITSEGGKLTGKIEKVFDPKKQDAKCEKCEDDRKDKPVLGMTIFSGLTQDAEERNIWAGAQILDPNNGKLYKMRLKVVDGGKKLEMRGYIAFLYRTQEWIRVE